MAGKSNNNRGDVKNERVCKKSHPPLNNPKMTKNIIRDQEYFYNIFIALDWEKDYEKIPK